MNESDRNKALDRLRTPEHLDRALNVTTPMTWLWLCVLLALTGAVVAWGFWGEISIYVEAEGIFLSRKGMVFDAASPGGGRLTRIAVAVGQQVQEGDVVAEIFDAETSERLKSAVALVAEHKEELRDRITETNEENRLAAENLARQRDRLDEMERINRELKEKAGMRLQEDRKLFAQRMIDRTAVERSEQALSVLQQNLFEVLRRRDALDEDDVRRRSGINSRLSHAKGELLKAEMDVSELRVTIETWRIRAPVSGRIIEIKAQIGVTLGPGESVLSIETGGEGLDVLSYVSALDGKSVKEGMSVLVTPATVRREEYGSMIGTVEYVSEFPASLNGMVAVLRNQELAGTFSASGPPYPARIALTPDATTRSGFAWTSPQATHLEITPGTLATVEIRASTQSPAALVLPWIKEKLSH